METCSNGIDIETVKITTSAISTAANLFCVAESSVGFIIIGDSHHISGWIEHFNGAKLTNHVDSRIVYQSTGPAIIYATITMIDTHILGKIKILAKRIKVRYAWGAIVLQSERSIGSVVRIGGLTIHFHTVPVIFWTTIAISPTDIGGIIHRSKLLAVFDTFMIGNARFKGRAKLHGCKQAGFDWTI